jgi:hypothetical protein
MPVRGRANSCEVFKIWNLYCDTSRLLRVFENRVLRRI